MHERVPTMTDRGNRRNRTSGHTGMVVAAICAVLLVMVLLFVGRARDLNDATDTGPTDHPAVTPYEEPSA